jgi:hypothetical protein
MQQYKHERFLIANEQLRGFLRRAESAANGTCMISDGDFQAWSRPLSLRDVSVGEASHSETLDTDLRNEIAEYVKNLSSLQTALETIRRILLCRQMKLDTTRRHFDGLQGSANGNHHTT